MANTALTWTQYTEAVVGLNHPTLSDTDNRALRQLLNRSGFGPDAIFRGFPIGNSVINAGSSDYTGPNTTRLTAAIADAVAASIPYCFVPRFASDGTAMLPFAAGSVTFNNAVKMIAEGTNPDVWDVRSYGAAIDGVTVDTLAFRAALSAAFVAVADGNHGVVSVPRGTAMIDSQLKILKGVRLVGQSSRGTRLKVPAITAFPNTGTDQVDSYMIRLGDGTTDIEGTAIEHVMLECGNGANGIYSSDVQDNCAIRHVLINNFTVAGATPYGIRLNGASGSFGSVNKCHIQNVEVYKANAGGNTGFAISLENGTFGILVENASVNSPAGNPYLAGIQTINCTAVLNNVTADIAGTDGIKVGSGSFCIINGLTGNNHTTTLHITASANIVVATGLLSAGTTTNTLVDDAAGGTPALTVTASTNPTMQHYSRSGQNWSSIGSMNVLDGISCGRAIREPVRHLTWSTTPAIDVSQGNHYDLTATSNIAAVIQNPTSTPGTSQSYYAGSGQEVTIEIYNNSGGALGTAPTFTTGVGAWLLSAAAVNPGNGTGVMYKFRWSYVRQRFVEVSRTVAF